MSSQSRSLPQAPPSVESAMALVCTLPPSARDERRVSVHDVLSRATASRELENGVAFLFENADETAQSLLALVLAEKDCCAQFAYSIVFAPQHAPIAFQVEGAGALVRPLKDLYLGLTQQARNDAEDVVE